MTQSDPESAAIILAAGKSTRMRSDAPKVLHEICGRPMLAYVLSACRLAGVDRLLVVVGHGRNKVMERFAADRDVTWIEQSAQKGTGHAVSCCKDELSGFRGSVIVVAGDMPLIQRDTVCELIQSRSDAGAALAMATTTLAHPTGYGRIVRDADGEVTAIVEERDCTDEQRLITEVNPSYYCFDAERLFDTLDKVKPARTSGEFYVTDAVRLLRDEGHGVLATMQVPPEEATGINDRLDLARVGRIMEDRIQLRLLGEGATIVDPDNTWIEADVTIGRDSVIYPFSFIGCGAVIGEDCRVGPHSYVGAGEVMADGTSVGGVHEGNTSGGRVSGGSVATGASRKKKKVRDRPGDDVPVDRANKDDGAATTATPGGVTSP